MQNFIGVDPGKSGAYCLLRVHPDVPPEIHFLDGSATYKETMDWLKECSRIHIRMAMLEDVQNIYGVSSKSNFAFGRSFEKALFSLEIADFGYDKVKPKDWQKEVGVKLKSKPKAKPGEPKPKKKVGNNVEIKKEVERLCNQLYPGCAIYGPKGGLLDGRSDALMLAHYCMLKYKV